MLKLVSVFLRALLKDVAVDTLIEGIAHVLVAGGIVAALTKLFGIH